MESKHISSAVIARLPRYYRYLSDLIAEGVERVSSKELSEGMHITASQIRQDLNNFGGFGQQGYGYNVKYLYDQIGKILGLDIKKNIIIIGAGHLGQALANYENFENRGFMVKALFDINPAMIGQNIKGAHVYPLDGLEDYLRDNKIDIATICIPKTAAEAVAVRLVHCGIKAIWNFAHLDLQLKLPEDVLVENVHLSESLMRLSYKIREKDIL